MPLDPSVRRFLDLLAAGREPGAPMPDVATRRQNFRALLRMAAGPSPRGIESRDDLIAGPGGPLRLRLYTPAAAMGEGPGLLFFHGGGFISGDLDTHDGVCRALASNSRCRIVAVDYRLAPEHPFPAALDDAMAALTALSAEPARWGIDRTRLAIGGDSVGANLAAVIARLWRDAGRAPLAAQLMICPILDLAGDFPSRRQFADGYYLDAAMVADDLSQYLPGGIDAADPRLSPLRASNMAGLPPAIIHAAEFDPFHDEALAYAAALRAAGVAATAKSHDGMIHLFYAFTRLIPQGGTALAAMGEELGGYLKSGG